MEYACQLALSIGWNLLLVLPVTKNGEDSTQSCQALIDEHAFCFNAEFGELLFRYRHSLYDSAIGQLLTRHCSFNLPDRLSLGHCCRRFCLHWWSQVFGWRLVGSALDQVGWTCPTCARARSNLFAFGSSENWLGFTHLGLPRRVSPL